MKNTEELNTLKEEVETLNKKPGELTEDEAEQVTGGYWEDCVDCPCYGHIRNCIKAKNRRQCPHGHTATD